MIRAGGWRDLGLLRRLTPRGVSLDSEVALTTGARVLQKGLVGLLAPRRGSTTLVWRGYGDETAAFAQMDLEDAGRRARVCFLAPSGAEKPQPSTMKLLECLAQEAGARGAAQYRLRDLRPEASLPLTFWVGGGENGHAAGTVHPEAEDAISDVLAAFLLGEVLDIRKPVYVCARSYQSWLRRAPQDAGFEPWGKQAVMVKHLTVSARKPMGNPLPTIAAAEVEVSVPVTKTSLIEATTTASNQE